MTEKIKIVRTLRTLRGRVWEWRGKGGTIAFVPTMGALHEGHLSLVRLARKKADKVIVSIFVNPTQFAPDEDFDSYPRTERTDLALLQSVGADMVYIPKRGSMYDEHHSTEIKVGGVAPGLETDHRPSFFDGVALVVAKLLNRVAPDIAIFGEKDYQQLATIRRLVIDLDMPVKIIGAKIARDEQGLALSSRNAYLDEQALRTARRLNEIMKLTAQLIAQGKPIQSQLRICADQLKAAGFSAVDYVSLADAQSLELIDSASLSQPARLLIAAHCHGVRLIDNCAVKPKG